MIDRAESYDIDAAGTGLAVIEAPEDGGGDGAAGLADRLAEQEARITPAREAVSRAYRTIGLALEVVRDQRLFRAAGFPTFDAYVNSRWRFTRDRAYQLITAARVSRDVPEVVIEAHARELGPLPDAGHRRAVWADARVIAGDGPVQAKHVREAADKVLRPKPPAKDATGEEVLAYRREIGDIPAGAEAFVIHPEPPPDGFEPDEPERELTDDEYVESLPARAGLSDECRAYFDAEALAYREADAHRAEFRDKFRPVAAKAKKAGRGRIGPYLKLVYRYIKCNDPTRWKACGDCKGTGKMVLIGKCANCKSAGYLIW